LLRNVLDSHAKTIQTAQNQRHRHYDDELQCFDYAPPQDAPSWAFVKQVNMIYDTEAEKTTEELSDNNNNSDINNYDII